MYFNSRKIVGKKVFYFRVIKLKLKKSKLTAFCIMIDPFFLPFFNFWQFLLNIPHIQFFVLFRSKSSPKVANESLDSSSKVPTHLNSNTCHCNLDKKVCKMLVATQIFKKKLLPKKNYIFSNFNYYWSLTLDQLIFQNCHCT